ncbi:MAG: HD domain-containing protein [Dehalogenimonas sp.]|uniref:HD domain-containing protein n=1 Tax=Candidatus Dehalogenimonas loeffleri TaxID=3127115 RepID=A0ABZ2J7Z0_9CHLR|nr:HD domain-containing protein [Dehalogenimonas sp.]
MYHDFLLKIFEAASLQRWNDKLRPTMLTELDKQSHKMIISYVLAKYEESAGNDVDWIALIERGLFELIRRITTTDIKPPIFHKIKSVPEQYNTLNAWVYEQTNQYFDGFPNEIGDRYKKFIFNTQTDQVDKILEAAHFYATKWEYEIVERANPDDFERNSIRGSIDAEVYKYFNLDGIKRLIKRESIKDFVDLCGALRFQKRWSHLDRVPQTSVLGHMLVVAIYSYIFSIERQICEKGRVTNYLTGLFHDLPEALTRDIISPVKHGTGIAELLKQYEVEQMEKEVFKKIPPEWHNEISRFTKNEFSDTIIEGDQEREVRCEELVNEYNDDRYTPRDGTLVKTCDLMAAFLEAYLAKTNGLASDKYTDAMRNIYNKLESDSIGSFNIKRFLLNLEPCLK